jgi:hypothetical protein
MMNHDMEAQLDYQHFGYLYTKIGDKIVCARCRGVGACAVTFTVGGLSVINAIAGAYSESLPVICLVGGPNSNDYGTNHILHHTIGETDFSQEFRCFKEVTCAQVKPNDATSEIHWEKKYTKNTGHETCMEMQMETQQDTDVVQWFAQNSGWIVVYTYYLCYTPTVGS